MPPQWTEWLLYITLRGGSVYYFQERTLTSPQPHYFVVLNFNPRNDEFLILLTASSKVAEVKRRNRHLPADTMVDVTPSEYADFSLPSIIDCNHWFRVSKQELLQKLQRRDAQEKAPMPDTILSKLRAGVIASLLVEGEIKDMLRTSSV